MQAALTRDPQLEKRMKMIRRLPSLMRSLRTYPLLGADKSPGVVVVPDTVRMHFPQFFYTYIAS